ncbi:MAG: argininosuccinate lyase [Clostridiales bacterium]|jgi:argininosuccinate lyase|nr:argininosuccinate lyase [Clostridiales bacterium]
MKLWGGRFTKSTDNLASHFHSSISFDQRLFEADIKGSLAHAAMLASTGIISKREADDLKKGLEELLGDVRAGKVEFSETAEDIHMNIEALLTERIGAVGKKLHTGRSRNDQVALDMRIYVMDEESAIAGLLRELVAAIAKIAREHIDTVMPGYTHLQRAQPVTFAHHILAYAEMFKRDIDRLQDASRRTNCMPLGAGALAASTYPLNRDLVRELLDFNALALNSMDAVSDRDFCIELLSAVSIIMMHLSRFCEEIVLWSSFEFKFIELDDGYATGSSIMPQKKNPDMAELIRGKTGRAYGDLIALLTVMKGLPLAYNKDMQEDKESVFDAVDTVKMCLPVFTGMISTMKVNKEAMRKACAGGFVNATDAADWLAKKGVAFRDAHEIIGKLVLKCSNEKKSLEELSLEEYKSASPVFDESIYDAISLETCVGARNVPGGPSRDYVEKLIEWNEEYLNDGN